jgi:hypothetical protein
VVAAFVLSMALHAGAVMWVETLREESPMNLVTSSEQS